MDSDTVLWWALALVIISVAFTYRTEFVDIFWDPPSGTSDHLFNQDPINYAADQLGSSIGSLF